ncbi:hypothetical protein OROMI_010274 [Orobanche minor]
MNVREKIPQWPNHYSHQGQFVPQNPRRLDFFSATEADSKKWLGFLGLKCNGLPGKLKLEWWRNRKGILDGKQIEKVDIEEHIV